MQLEKKLIAYSIYHNIDDFDAKNFIYLNHRNDRFGASSILLNKNYMDFIEKCAEFIKNFSARKRAISLDELKVYFNQIHIIAIAIIYDIIDNYENNIAVTRLKMKMIDEIEKNIVTEKDYRIVITKLYQHDECIKQGIRLSSAELADNPKFKYKNGPFILFDFVNFYLKSIEKFIYPEFYTASFMKECYNSSVWGHYAKGHSGICLIFEVDEKIELERVNKSNTSSNERRLEFKEVIYNDDFEEIDFFSMLWRMPEANLNYFYSDENGNLSPIGKQFMESIEIKRGEYWQHIDSEAAKKTKDWEYEKEYRLIINSHLNDSLLEEEQTYKYHFSDLHGIIFGMNTSEEDKIKIIEIIQAKCKNEGRKNFVFYQAYFCQVNKNIQHIPISIAKV